jgi:prevent-host-death family protein
MRKVNIHEAKTTLSQLVEAAERGEDVIIARAGRPVARLTALTRRPRVRFGGLKGKIPERLIEDVAMPLSEEQVLALFAGSIEP